MIRATDLRDRAVVDLGTGAKIGAIDELVLDPAGRQVAGLIVTDGRGMLGRGARRTIPAVAAFCGVPLPAQGTALLEGLEPSRAFAYRRDPDLVAFAGSVRDVLARYGYAA